MNRIEKASGVSPFPPTIVIPEAVYDFTYNVVIHSSVTLHKGKKFVYLVIELSTLSLLYMGRSMFLGLLAHEFLHYAVHTVNFHKKITELESQGNHESPVVIGVIPNKEKMTWQERDQYFYGDPQIWFNDKEVVRAVKDLEAMKFNKTALDDKVMEWIKQGKPMKEYVRGEIKGFRGELWLHQPIIERAKKLERL